MSEKRIGGRPRGQTTIVSSEQVYIVILDRFAANPPRPTSRRDVMAELGCNWPLVDGAFDRLEAKNRIVTVQKGSGYFVPVNMFVDRAVSLTAVPGERFKGEVGDEIINLSPRELETFVALGFGLVRR